MESFVETLEIHSSAESVWDVIADYGRDPEWRTGVISMKTEPERTLAVGTITHEVIRVAGRTYRTTGRVDRVVDGATIAWHTTSGAEAHGTRTVRAIGRDRCEVTLELHVVPRGVNRLLAPVLRRMLASNLRRDLAALAALCAPRPANV